MKICIYVIGIALMAVSLWGCVETAVPEAEGQVRQSSADMRNVEERDYATILIIEKNDAAYKFTLGIAKERRTGEKSTNETVCQWECRNLTELAETYQEEKGKDLSLAHLKVLLCVTEKAGCLGDTNLLKMLEQDVEVAKTIPLLLLEDSDAFLEYLEGEEKPVGNYVENLTKVKNQQGEKVSTVADYLKAWRENETVTPFYFMKSAEGFRVSGPEKEYNICK